MQIPNTVTSITQISSQNKQLLLNKLTNIFTDTLPSSELNKVMQTISTELSNYDLSYTSNPSPNQITQPDTISNELMQLFLLAKTMEGRSPKTIDRYKYCISHMLQTINLPIPSINVYILRNHFMEEKSRGLSDNTIDGYRSVLCSFFRWLYKDGLIALDPTANIHSIKCAKIIRFPFSDTEIKLLDDACTSDRDKAILYFLLSTGCRISEVCKLDRSGIDFNTLECKVLGKGNKERVVYLNDVAGMIIKRYIDSRSDSFPALFIGKGSDRMTPGGIRFMLTKLGKRVGVENVHPHRFRRTLTSNLIKRGMDIHEVAKILGHEKIDTTMKYIYTPQEDVKNSYRKFAS